MVRKVINIGEEEDIANEVKKHLCLYCKNSSAFRDKRAKADAWTKIEEALGLEEGSAETRFVNLRQRYRKKKNAVIKAKPSGTGRTNNLEAAEANLQLYDFLKWLDPYIAGASSVSNVVDDNDERAWTYENEVTAVQPDLQPETQEDSEEFEDFDDEQQENKFNVKEQNTIIMEGGVEEEKEEGKEDVERELVQDITDQKKINNARKRQLEKVIDGVSSLKKFNVLETISKRRFGEKEKRTEKMVINEEGKDADESDVFGKMVAFELRSLPKRKQIKLKHDINNAIFKYQCEVEEEENEEQLQKEKQHRCQQQQQLVASLDSSKKCLL